jgi:hypothetical protein
MRAYKVIQFDEKKEREILADIISLAQRAGVDEDHVKALNVLYCGTMVTQEQLTEASVALAEISSVIKKNAHITFDMLKKLKVEHDVNTIHDQVKKFEGAYNDGVNGNVRRLCEAVGLLLEAAARISR